MTVHVRRFYNIKSYNCNTYQGVINSQTRGDPKTPIMAGLGLNENNKVELYLYTQEVFINHNI